MGFREYSFEKLVVWQRARELSGRIYQITRDYPTEERYGLISQMRRSAISVASNLAEGSARITNKDKAHFSTQAYSSLMELLNQIILSFDLGFISIETYHDLRKEVDRVAFPLNKLRTAQLK